MCLGLPASKPWKVSTFTPGKKCGTALLPVIWVVFYAIFLALNIFGVALSYRVTLVVTLASLAVLVAMFAWLQQSR